MNSSKSRCSLSSEKPVLGNEEPDRDVEPVTQQAPDRRRLFRRLVTLAGLGITGVLLSQEKIGLLPIAQATSGGTSGTALIIDGSPANSGTATTTLNSTTDFGSAFYADATATSGTTYGVYGQSNSTSGTGVYGLAEATTGTPVGVVGVTEGVTPTLVKAGVQGVANTGTGVLGQSTSDIGVEGQAEGISAIPLVANGFSGQTAHLQEWQVAGTVKSVVDKNGRFGIGTSSPLKLLHVGAGTDSPIFSEAGIYATNAGTTALELRNSTAHISLNAYADTTHAAIGAGTNNNFALRTNNLDRVTLDTSGNVGIGTTTPARAVHLQGHNANFRMDRDIDTSAFILVRTAAGNFNTIWKTFYVGVNASGVNNGSFFIGDNGTNVAGTSTTRLIIDNTGRVGLGRTPTANNLEVEGTASKTTAGSWLANSDMRIKTDIEDIDDALATIRKLHPVRFRYTDSYKAKHPSIKNHPYYNFIAQEYREVFPDSVQDDGGGLLQMDSYNVTPYLVQAMKEQQKTIERLQERIDELERSMKEFTSS